MKHLFLATALAATLLSACGGGGTGSGIAPASSAPPGPQASGATNSVVQINLGDAPADRLLAVGMTVNSLAFTHANGSTVSVLNAPRPVEMMQLMGTVTPLALVNMPAGEYRGATMTFGGAVVTHVDPATGQVVQHTVPGPMTANLSFNPPLTIGAAPTVVNLDMHMAASVGIDANGNVTLSPTLTAKSNPMLADSRHPEDGGLRGATAMVGSVGGNGFTLAMVQGITGVSMGTHEGTHYDGLAGMGMMAGSMLVSVDAMPRADGSWRVDHVQARMGAGGAMAAGIVSGITGNPPTQLTLVMHDGAGNGMSSADLAATTTVNIGTGTQFAIDGDDVDLAGLPFVPGFDRTRLSKGQAIRAWSSQPIGHHGMGGMQGGRSVEAASIELKQQGLRGTVSAYASNGAQGSFTLTLPADSAFAKLAGATTVVVYRRGSTELRGLSSLTNGDVVVVRGLLFVDGGTFRLVASRIVAAP